MCVCVGQGSRWGGTEIATPEEEVETRSREKRWEKMKRCRKKNRMEEREQEQVQELVLLPACLREFQGFIIQRLPRPRRRLQSAQPRPGLWRPSRWEPVNLAVRQLEMHMYCTLHHDPSPSPSIHIGSRDGRRRLEKWLVPDDSSSP